jgi:hypothetical protein
MRQDSVGYISVIERSRDLFRSTYDEHVQTVDIYLLLTNNLLCHEAIQRREQIRLVSSNTFIDR